MTARIKNVTVRDSAPDVALSALAHVTMAAGYAHGLLAYATQLGACRATLLAQAGLSEEILADHFNRLPFSRYIALIRAAKSALNDPALAAHFGASVSCAELSLISLIGAACETVAEAHAMLNRYGRIALDTSGIHGDDHFVLQHDRSGVWLVDNRQHFNLCPELTESTFARMVTSVRRFFGAELIRAVEFSHATPTDRAAYDRVFAVPLRFGQSRNAIRFDPAWLAQPVSRAPRYTLHVLTEKADALLASLDRARSMRGRVEAALIPELSVGDVSMTTVAQILAMSRPTLYRALKREGISFEHVLDALRHRLALEYLADERMSVNDASRRLGFSDPTAFSRAFKRWTGRSPRQHAATVSLPRAERTDRAARPHVD